ncbi:MAG: formylmethanofuran dehydrogenase subunit B [Candidatus Aenigmatarchaeota archaeon]|nr:MAG: formylmethanofuran dehydrogenase subunit B [Candidatus Aenigmarchaeota archaeon]
MGITKILHYNKKRVLYPYVRINGRLEKCDLQTAISKAVEILSNAKFPLLFGWSNTTVEAIRVGAELAEYLGGVFDNTSVVCHGPTILGVQEAGFVSATLGQVRNYADLIIYWGCNPLNAHPRHVNRYSALAKGVYIKSRKERKVVVIDVRETDSTKIADMFIRIKPGMDYEFISALRALIKGYDVEADEVAGVDIATIEKLVEMMISARFGVIFYGLGLTMSMGKGRNIEEIIRLAQDLNEWTKFVAIPMRGHYNVVGANQVSAWTTGFAFAVDFRRGYPRHNPGITSATDLLERGDVDAALVVASDPVAHLPKKAVEHLLNIPIITLDPKWSLTASVSTVLIPTAIAGVEVEGTAYRMDKVPLRLKKLVDPPEGILSDEEVLKILLDELKKKMG